MQQWSRGGWVMCNLGAGAFPCSDLWAAQPRVGPAALDMGWGGSKLLPLLGANNAAWRVIPAVLAPARPPLGALVYSQRMPDRPLHGISTCRQGASPVVPRLSPCPGSRTVHQATSSLLPCPLPGTAGVGEVSLALCGLGEGVHSSGSSRDLQLLEILWRGGH